jgi:ribosomal RNA-processing protein 12
MTTSLLSLPRLGNPFLSQLAYSLLADLFESAPSTEETNLLTQIPAVLRAVLSSPPSKSDPTLPSAWVHLLGITMLAYHAYDINACAAELPKVWKAVWNWMESPDSAVRSTTAASLGLLIKCMPPPLVEVAIHESSTSEEPKTLVNRIIRQLTEALDAISYARAIPQVFEVISLLITHLRKNASEKLLESTIHKIALLRVNKSFEHKESADATLSIAMKVLGPQILLRFMPLNLEPADRFFLFLRHFCSEDILITYILIQESRS